MFGLPGQSRGDLARDLDQFLAAAPEHLSCYGLTLEEGTPLADRHRATPLAMPDDDHFAACYRFLDQRLREAGYNHYEISNFARPGRECRHNLGYWHRQPCLGLGAGAHTFDLSGWGVRRAVPADLALFAADLAAGRNPTRTIETFDRRGAMSETLYLGLRAPPATACRTRSPRTGPPAPTRTRATASKRAWPGSASRAPARPRWP
jgi:oxygen-independent coproporphyrinogen-3 oxidase